MDSPPECVLALSCEQPRSPSTLPSLDHSPLASSPAHLSLPSSPLALPLHSPEASPLSSDTAPYFALSPFALHQEDGHHQEDPHHHHLLLRHHEEEEEEDDDDEGDVEGRDGAPPSPTPAVALFPGGGGTQEVRFSPGPESSPPATPLAPLLGFGALELALASGQGGSCNDELDLQLFQKDAVAGVLSAVGGASSAVPALRFPCLVCGKRFRFQSILSLHARAHSLDRERRAAPLYRSGLSQAAAQPHLKALQNHKDIAVQNKHNLQDQRPFPATLIQHLTEEEDEEGEEEGEEGRGLEDVLHMEKRQNCLLDGNVPLTPPLTEDPVSLLSPYPSASAPAVVTAASAYRCHACKGKFRTASELERHVRILHNPYKCTLCAFSASQEESLAAHLQECHPSPRATLAPSPIYSSRAIIAATPDTPVPTPTPTPAPTPAPGAPQTAAPTLPAFRCDTCGQRFTQSWFLKGHMRKHKDSLDHKCQVCGRGFKEPWFLKNHMKVHLNKLGLKAGLGGLGVAVGAEQQASGPVSSQSLSALYSSLLLAQRRGAGGGGRGGRGRSERDPGGRGMVPGSGKSAILGYLGLPIDGGGASCMERLQAVAQVAEMGGVSSSVGGGSGAGDAGSRAGGTAEAVAAAVADGGEQAAMWQLVARSLLAAQQAQQQRGHQQSQRGPSRTPIIGEADQVRAYLGGLDPRQESASSAGVEGGGGGGSGGPWECPDCGKLFRSLQQVVVHARVHVQRPQKGGGEESSGSGRATGKSGRGKAKLQSPGLRQAASASGFHSVISSLHGENGLPAVSSMATGPSRERVRGSGVKDCPYCGKAFRSSHHLKVHLRVHTGERPYKCPHCDYAGTQSGSLKYHLQRHHREQRNALSASSSSASSSTSSNNSPTISSLAPGAPSRRDGPGKQGRSQGRQGSQGSGHSQGSRGLTDTPISRHHQQPWLLGVTDHQRGQQKTLAALQEVDVETQYRYLSGVMGALYQGGLEGGWIRESPPLPKTPKVSRRKPLTTSRMVQLSNGSDKEGAAPPVTLEGGFEPLDLSRRPSPGPGGGAEYGGSVCVGVNRGGEPRAVDTLNQCLFCPFRTSSAELMAMHLQVNHTSKSRRKRGPSAAPDHEGPSRPRQPRMDHADPDPMAAWRYASQAEDQELTADWASSQSQSHNGFSESRVEPRGGPLDQQGSSLASVSGNFHRSQVDEEEEEENMKDDEDEDEEGEGDLEPPEENSSPVGSPGETGPPLLGFEHIMREEGGVVTD